MKNLWQLQEAKSHFSQVVNEALSHGPQKITRHGEEVVVVLSLKEFQKMTRRKGDIVNFFSKSPLADIDIEFTRSKEGARDMDL